MFSEHVDRRLVSFRRLRLGFREASNLSKNSGLDLRVAAEDQSCML